MPVAGGDPVDEMLVDPPVETETVTVTLVDVQADLWWAWDVDGAAWLLPAYRFIGDDGGWYTVPAVTDEFLIRVDPPVPIDEPIPVEPDGGIGDGAEPLPDEIVFPTELVALVGGPLADFSAGAAERGWTVRVVEQDGEGLDRTDDFRTDRVNVAVETVDGVGYVVRATLDDGTLIGEAVPATEPTANGAGDAVPLVGLYEGVRFYPACGNETLDHEGATWHQIQSYEYPDLYDAATRSVRADAPEGIQVNGLLRVAEPGPGDDVGTLLVWDDGFAYFVSDSGDLSAWLTTDELTYDWVC